MPGKIKILVTGANGQLGKEMVEAIMSSSATIYNGLFYSKEQLSIDDEAAVNACLEAFQPHYLVNCAAYTAVDKAEQEKELAFKINAEAVGVLAAACKKYGTRLIHFSTDYVFDGTSEVPYKEDDGVNPQSVYGASKLEGERLAMKNNPDTMIIRTSWVYSVYGKNFVKTMVRLLKEKEMISVVNDQFGSPTYAKDIAALVVLISGSRTWKPGIYHFSNDGIISWYDFAVFIKDSIGSSCTINPIPTSGYPTPARRPAYSALDSTKARNTFGVNTRDWRGSLENCLDELAQSTGE